MILTSVRMADRTVPVEPAQPVNAVRWRTNGVAMYCCQLRGAKVRNHCQSLTRSVSKTGSIAKHTPGAVFWSARWSDPKPLARMSFKVIDRSTMIAGHNI